MSRLLTLCALGAVAGLCAAASPALAQYATKSQPVASETAPLAAAAGPRAFGLINADASIARSTGISGVSTFGTGEYCVTLQKKIHAATAVPVLTFNYNSSDDFDVFITYGASGSASCPGNSVTVYTYNADAGGHTFANEGFTIVIP